MARGMIPEEHKWRYFFHMTDIDNLESILEHGLLCTNEKNRLGIKHTNIANNAIQERRAEMRVPCGHGGVVHDYVPFYWTSVNPMLLGQINAKNCDQPRIIFLCFKIDKLISLDSVFTDAAANSNQAPNFYDDASQLAVLSWDLIDKQKWGKSSDEDRHRKMAEVLIYNKVDSVNIDSIVVFNEYFYEQVKDILQKTGSSIDVRYSLKSGGRYYNFYYTKFTFHDESRRRESLVLGPKFLQESYMNMMATVKNAKAKKDKAPCPYQSISDLLNAIRISFSAIKELQGIWQLETSNTMHHKTVSDHTLEVVDLLKQLNYYKQADEYKKELLELAAYLHDIGKGPKEKWKDGIQQPFPDHPFDAISMLERIFVKEVESVPEEDVRIIGLLVAYHDIIGESISGNRNIEALRPLLKSEEDFDMLACLSEADIKSIDNGWWINFRISIDNIRAKFFPHE